MPPTTVHRATCPQCGASVAAEAPEGLCTRCVAALCLQADTAAGGTEARSAEPPLAPEEVAPHFPQLEILACLGRGGMGVVYKARQRSLNRLVALKLLAPERVTDSKFAQRFVQEAQVLATLSHPNIVTVHEFGQTNGRYFLIMEFIDGVTLRQAMKAGRFTPEQALSIVPTVCEALQYAHEHDVVHRDIKPENLLIDKHGRVKIADFGIAKMLKSDGPESWFAEAEMAGTPQYMAPEQKERGVADNRADIYSLGVVLYELLTGELPADKLKQPLEQIQIDEPLHEIVRRALHANPEMRYQTAADMRDHLETLFVSAPPTRTKPRLSDVDAFGQSSRHHPPLIPRRWPIWPMIATAAAGLAIGAVVYFKPAPTAPVLPAIVESVDFNSGSLTDAFFVNVQSGSEPYKLVSEVGLGSSRGVIHHYADPSKDATLVYKAKGFDLSTLDSLEASCFVRKRGLATVPGTGPLSIGLVGAKNGFLGGNDDKTTTEDAFLLVKIGMAEAPSSSAPWRLIMQSKAGDTDGVMRPALGDPFPTSNESWYHLSATFKRIDDKTIEVRGHVSNADDQGRVGSVITTIGPTTVAIADLASDHQVWVGLRGFGASGADVWDNFSIKANGLEAGPCAAPTVSAIRLEAYRVPLVWKDNSTTEDSFIVSRATTPGGPYTELAKLAANTTNYTDRTANRMIANYYKVRAVNASSDAASEQLAVPAYESPYRWENVPIGSGGFIPGLHVHPSEPNLIYVRTGQGGIYRWDAERSRWIPIMEHLRMEERNWYGGEGIALDPRNPDVIYAACGRLAGPSDGPGAIFKSTDRGLNWTKLPFEGVKMAAREARRGTGERLVMSPHDSNLLLFGSRNDGLWRSANAGASWARVDSFPNAGVPLMGIVAVAFDPQTAGVVYAAVFGEGVYRSSDNGVSWTRLAESPEQVNRLLVSRTGVLFATHQFGVSRYAAGAWTPTVPGGAAVSFSAVTINPADGNDMLVAEAEAESSKIYRSRDGGGTWARVEWTTTNKIPWNNWGYSMSRITAMEFDPTVPGRVWLTESNGIQRTDSIDASPVAFANEPKGFEYGVVMTLVASASGSPLLSGLTDTDGFRHDNGLDAYPSRLMASPESRVIDTYSLAVCEREPSRVVRGAGNRTRNFQVLTSADGGATWETTSWGKTFPKKIPMRIAVSATDPNNFVVVADSGGAQVTTDNGKTWLDVKGLPGGIGGPWVWTQPLAADRKLGGTFYYFDGKGVVLRSSNQGRSFERINSAALGSSGWYSIKTMPGKPGEVWICLDSGGLFHSSDGGVRFTAVPKVRRANLFAFGKPAPGRDTPALYVLGRIGDSEDGIYRSLDLGETWTELTDPQVAIGNGPNVMEASAHTFGLVFIGSNARGVYMGQPRADVTEVFRPASVRGTTPPQARPALRQQAVE